MDREPSLFVMETSMLGDSIMGKNMVKEHTLTLMDSSMLGSSRMGEIGTPLNTTKTETSEESM